MPQAAPAGSSVATAVDAPVVVQAPTAAGPVGLAPVAAVGPVAGKVDGKQVVFTNKADLVVQLLPGGFETTVIVPDGSAKQASSQQVLTVPAGVTARNGGPGVELVNGAGKVIGSYGSGFATDAAAHPVEAEVLTRMVSQAGAKVTVSISVDPKWLADPARVFPVSIDPTLSQNTGASGAMDTFVNSVIQNTPQSTATDLKVGQGYGTTSKRRALLKFDMSSLRGPNRQVLSANLALYNSYSPSCGSPRAVQVRSLAAPFDANTLWSNQPAFGATTITSAPFAKGYNSTCPAGFQDIDIKDLAQKWVDGSTNNGMAITAADENDSLGDKTILSGETIGAPTLTVTYNRPPTNGTMGAPATGSTVNTTRPVLTANPGSDPDGDALRYWWTVSTNPDGSGQVLSSGWQNPGQTSWTVPAGSLLDSTTYYWNVATWDGTSWPDLPPVTPSSFTVDLRLGDSGTWPTDELGPAKVNLTNGNLVVSTSSPSMPTVGGGLGVNYTYNSKADTNAGLTGAYYTGFNASTHAPDAGQEPTTVRRDTVTSFDWKTGSPGAPVPVDNFYTVWNGYLQVPTTGGYKIGGACDTPGAPTSTGGVRYQLDTAAMTSYVACNSTGTDPWSATVNLTAGQIVPIKAEYWSGTGQAKFDLKVRGPGLPAPGGADVPSDWLSTTAPSLPEGWNLSADLDGAANYRAATITTDAITFVDLEGTNHRYAYDAAKKAYQPPAGETGTVGRTTGGGVTLLDDDGQTYAFAPDGHLDSVTSALDYKKPAAAQMIWSGTPLRLTAIKDPVSGRQIDLQYAGDPGCASAVPTGLAKATAGMLCGINWRS